MSNEDAIFVRDTQADSEDKMMFMNANAAKLEFDTQ